MKSKGILRAENVDLRTVFGPFWGSIWNLTGATLPFWSLATSWGRVARKASGLANRLIDGVDAESWRFVAPPHG